MEVKLAISRRVALLMAVEAAAMLLPPPALSAAAKTAAAETDPRACTRRCGHISIPYPFGIEPGCYLTGGFNLTCNRSHRPPQLFLGDGTVQVLGISVPNATVRINSIVVKFPGGAGGGARGTWGGALGDGGPYYLAEMRNKLVANGCNVQVLLTGDPNQTVSTCSAFCNEDRDGGAVIYVAGHCSGVGCCQAEILVGRSSYGFQTIGIMNGEAESNGWACVVESELDADPNQLEMVDPRALPAVLGWRINQGTCHGNKSSPACRSRHSFCENITNEYATIGKEEGHLCHCARGYEGNPYIPNGCHDVDECKYPGACYGDCKNTQGGYQCQCPPGFEGNASIPNGCKDIDECAHRDTYPCYGICINMPGTFHCQCKSGTSGDPLNKGGCIATKIFPVRAIGLGVGGGIGLLLEVIAAPFIFRTVQEQMVKNVKERFFKQNHGLLLQQLISQRVDIGGRMIITLAELEKATNNFDASHKIGGGGHGVVYKGLLDLQVVAIKKSKIIVQREIDDFINKVAILSHINHRNVIKLLGCCLETEVPLLVYEFISNGTLAHHLHVEGPKSLSWDDRLRIALEISRALAYLHSAASTPILHRDIKSSNILLDDNLTAKVSDLGASKYIQIDQTGVTTVVQGTIGYLDPMYYYTCRLTNMSDVFSFGVLLIELLTRKKPFVFRTNDGGSLVSHFVSLLAEGCLADIIDPQIIEEDVEQVDEVATLAAMCTKLNGEDWPTMREVEMALENLSVAGKQENYYTTSRRKYEKDQTAAHYMSLGGLAAETSRQYTMEEEMLLSASYPR
ncbi:wall-associated receptor kinase 1-like [Panicum miliaceum]|uniref:Wall-associated receptor kinase 1-like n=1 Tax=Panicum miliaceum TaxID=4540 RepID=A0A3L6PN19_PANMI|nr:wall-associated receptor kinase 1-like [Panicum miliaceum]